MDKHWDKQYRDGGSISSDRRLKLNEKYIEQYANGGGVGDLIISEIVDGEIRIYEKNINNLLSFVGEGIGSFDVYSESLSGKSNIKTDEIQNEVNITFVENAWGGISLEEWEQVKNKLDKYIGKGGFEDYTINSSSNSLTLEFVGEYPIGEYANGGGVERIDLFEDYENIPQNVQTILDIYAEKFGDDFGDMDYKDMADMHNEIYAVGYTFDSYLDNQPYGLRPIGVPLNELKGYEDMGEEYANGGGVEGGVFGIKSSGYHRHNYSLVSGAFFKYNENYEKAFEIWNLEKPKIKEFIEKNGGWNIDFGSMGIKERPKNNWRQDPFINLVVSFNIDGENEIGKNNIIDYYSGIGKNKIGDMYWDYVNSKYYYYEKSMRDGGWGDDKYAKGGGVENYSKYVLIVAKSGTKFLILKSELNKIPSKRLGKLEEQFLSVIDEQNANELNHYATYEYDYTETNPKEIEKYISGYKTSNYEIIPLKEVDDEEGAIAYYGFYVERNGYLDFTSFPKKYAENYAEGGGIKGKELWFSPYGELKTEKRGTAKDYIEKNLAKSFGAEYMELVGEDEKDYIYELNGNPMMIAAKTAILQEETDLDIETYGRKKRVHIPKKSIDQISVQLRYPLITPFKNGGGVDSPKYDNASNWNPDYCKCIKDIRFKDSLNFFEGFEYTYDEDKYIRVYYMDGRGVTMTKETFDKHFEKIGKDKDKQAYANGGAIKTDFNELENTELRNVLISFWNDFFNNHIGNYLSIEKENYILSNIDNVFVIVRDEDKGNFSDVEKQNIDSFLSPYFDSDKKPLFTDFFNNYKIKDNKIIIYIKEEKMYANGGGVDYDTRWAEMEAYSPYTSRAEYENKKEYEDLAFASKTFSKTSEMLVRENLNNGEICMCKLTKILGHEPNYPIQIVGSLKLEKCFMKRFYRIV